LVHGPRPARAPFLQTNEVQEAKCLLLGVQGAKPPGSQAQAVVA
jgi:hypothetical protein